MKDKKETNFDLTEESHSQKLERLLNHIPSFIGIWSFSVTLLIFIAVIVALMLTPYPYSNGESILSHLVQSFFH